MWQPANGGSPISTAFAWVSFVTTVALEMAVPALVGFWIDTRVGTRPVFATIGGILGLVLGMLALLRMPGVLRKAQVRRRRGPCDSQQRQGDGDPTPH